MHSQHRFNIRIEKREWRGKMAISTIQTTNKESDSNACRWFPKRVTNKTPKHPLSVTIRGQSSGYSSRILLTNLRDSESHLLKCLPVNFRNAGGSSEISNETSSIFSSATYRTLLSHTLKRKNKQHVSKSVRIPHKYIYDKQKYNHVQNMVETLVSASP